MHCQLLKMIHWSINKMLDEHQKLMYYLISCASSCQLISVSCYYDYIQPLVVVEQLPIDICTSGWLISKIFYRLGVFWSFINWFHLYIVEFRRKKKTYEYHIFDYEMWVDFLLIQISLSNQYLNAASGYSINYYSIHSKTNLFFRYKNDWIWLEINNDVI